MSAVAFTILVTHTGICRLSYFVSTPFVFPYPSSRGLTRLRIVPASRTSCVSRTSTRTSRSRNCDSSLRTVSFITMRFIAGIEHTDNIALLDIEFMRFETEE